MTLAHLQRRLNRIQQRLGDRLTILLLVLTFVVVPLHASGWIVAPGYGFAIVLVMAGSIVGAPAGLWAVIVMLVGVALALAAGVIRFMHPSWSGIYLDTAAWIMVGTALAYVVARAVFAPGRVTYHRIIGAVLLYLTIGQIFVGLYAAVGLLEPGAFSAVNFADRPKLDSDLIYFSFVTLTTVGYGDILPVHPLARSLSNLEAIIGQLYPATLLARLVSLEIEDRRK